MAGPREPTFLARDSYRRRRISDAARLVPIMGFLLLLLPGFMTVTAEAMLYIFGVWAFLIFVIGLLSQHLADRNVPPEIRASDEASDG